MPYIQASRDVSASGIAEADDVASEDLPLITPQEPHSGSSKPVSRLGRRLVAGVATFACAAAVVVVQKASTTACTARPSTSPLGEQSFVTLVEKGPEDLVYFAGKHGDRSAIAQWLAVSSVARQAAQGAAGAEGDAEVHAEAEKAVEKAMAVKDEKEAKQIAQRAMGRALSRWHSRRKGLKDYLKAHAGGLRRERTPSEKASVASCTFNTLQATTQLAALATSINDAARTCSNENSETSRKICALNTEQILASVAAVAATLSLAANNCAETLVPNVDALCSGTITGLLQSLMEFSIGAELTSSACRADQRELVLDGVAPSNIGQAGTPDVLAQRRLGEHNATAHARRLLFGGGKGATATFCSVDVTSTAWYLAQAGIAINAAANPKAGATCPAKHEIGGNMLKDYGYEQSQGFCTVDIAGAIYGFLQAIKYIQMAVVQCTDTWNYRALCGAGIDGMLAQMDAVAYFGSAMWLSCDELRDPHAKLSPRTKASLKNNALGNSGNFGRRLSTEDSTEGVAALQQQFAEPEEAWRSIGFDVSSPYSELRKVEVRMPQAEEIVELVKEEAPAKEAGASAGAEGGLFRGLHRCT